MTLKRLFGALTAVNATALMLVTLPATPAVAAGGTPPMVYVTNYFDNTVTPINTSSNAAGTPVGVGTAPASVAITPDGRTAYVYNFQAGTVTPIALATNTAGAPISVGTAFTPQSGDPAFPHIRVTPDGSTVYVV